MKREDYSAVVAIITDAVRQRPTRDPKLTIEELWSEAYTLASRGSAARWQYAILAAETSGHGDYWFARVRGAVLRRVIATRCTCENNGEERS